MTANKVTIVNSPFNNTIVVDGPDVVDTRTIHVAVNVDSRDISSTEVHREGDHVNEEYHYHQEDSDSQAEPSRQPRDVIDIPSRVIDEGEPQHDGRDPRSSDEPSPLPSPDQQDSDHGELEPVDVSDLLPYVAEQSATEDSVVDVTDMVAAEFEEVKK